MRRRVYLSGAMERADDPNTWRDEMKEEFQHVEFIDPTDFGLDPYKDRYELVWKEFRIIMNCDFVFHNYIKGMETYGTPIEIAWAYFNNIPVMTWSLHEPEEMPMYAVVFSDRIHDDAETLIRSGWDHKLV